jgi:phosphopentomutase
VSLFLTIVLDGVGIGAAADADSYGDAGSDTLGHVCSSAMPELPNLQRLGLGCIAPLTGVPCVPAPEANFGKMRELSAGKDSTSGHWELAGLHIAHPFPTYARAFPPALVGAFKAATGVAGVLGNEVASGTEIIARLGEEHERTGWPIVYTSSDSVFQVAAHVDTITLDDQYELCQTTRNQVCIGEHAVGRVIARPFTGPAGAYRRMSEARRDFALEPPHSLLDTLREAGVRTVSIGKVADLFAHHGFDVEVKTRSNAEGITATVDAVRQVAAEGGSTFIWVNLVDFDQEFGHRNEVDGFAGALMEFDESLPGIINALPAGARLLITADHGNDPTFPGTDHTREYVPVLLYPGIGKSIGIRDSFRDHAATVSEFFNLPGLAGTSFL